MNTQKRKRPHGIAGYLYWVKRGFPGEWYVMEGKFPSTGQGEHLHTANTQYNARRMADRLTSEAYWKR